MARKTPANKLSDEIHAILGEYAEEVTADVGEIIKSVSKAGAKALRAQSKRTFGGIGVYAKAWTSTMETGRTSSQGIIYNKDLPGLPHLLEHGHLNRDGSRTPGRVHIAKIEEQLVKDLEKELIRRL